MHKLVIAHYQENLSWSDGYDRFVVQKDIHLPNEGREPTSYIWYIIKNYDSLEGSYIFCQGNPFDHCCNFKDFIESNPEGFQWVSDLCDLECDNDGLPHDSGLEIDKFLFNCGLYPQDLYHFNAGCQFSITAEQIKKQPKEYYIRVYEALLMTKKAPWAFERVIPIVFGVQDEM